MGIGMSMAAALIFERVAMLRSFFTPITTLQHTCREDKLLLSAGMLLGFLPVIYLLGSGAADAAASIIAVLFLAHSTRQRRWEWLRTAWLRLALLLWAYMLVRGGFAAHPAAAWHVALPWIRFPLFAMACASWLLPLPAIRDTLRLTLSVVVCFLIADSLFQYAVGVDIIGRPTYPAYEGGIRLSGPFSAPKVGIVLAWIGLPVILERLLRSDLSARQHMLTFGLGIAYITAIFLSGERMALLLSGFGGCLAIASHPTIFKRIILPAVIAAVLASAFVWSNPSLFARQIDSTLRGIQHVQHTPYGMIWGSAWKMIEAQPVFGVGARHFRLACPDAAYGATDVPTLKLRCNLHPHQLYLEWLSEGGIVALILALVMLGYILRHIIRCYPQWRHDGLWLGIVIALALRLWPLSTGVSLFVGWSAVPFWLMIGWALSYAVVSPPKESTS
jgi:O-antigen ligase